MATHHTPGPLSLKVRIASGRCEIETADTDQTTVEAEPLDGSEAARAAVDALVEELRPRGDGHELAVEVPALRRFRFMSVDGPVLVRIRAPHGTDVDARTASAEVVVSGRAGDADVRTASGGVLLAHVGGRATVKTASGRVVVRTLEGDGELNAMSGNVLVGEARSSVSAHTMSGGVRLERAFSGQLDLRTMSAPIEVGIPQGVALYVDANSASGEVRSELPVSDTAPGRRADLELRASSMSGDITLTRAPQAAAAGA